MGFFWGGGEIIFLLSFTVKLTFLGGGGVPVPQRSTYGRGANSVGIGRLPICTMETFNNFVPGRGARLWRSRIIVLVCLVNHRVFCLHAFSTERIVSSTA